jgi:hypothetical protein
MELMAEADNVVRRLLPTVLESTGENEEARRLRDHSKLSSRTAKSICRLLSTVNIGLEPTAFAFYINKVTRMLATNIYNKRYLN